LFFLPRSIIIHHSNHWETPSYLLSVEDPTYEGGGRVLKQHIWNAARDTIEEWTGYKQSECSLYGIRVYKEGAMLAPHVDRMPLVSSAIINVDQDVDEPWPLSVVGHDGIERNVTMEPGDLVLYESHSIIHGTYVHGSVCLLTSATEVFFVLRVLARGGYKKLTLYHVSCTVLRTQVGNFP